MSIAVFVAIIALLVYVANVICCAVICEAEGRLSLIKGIVFFIPAINILMFFYFSFFIKDEKHTRLQYAVTFLRMPAKNYMIIEALAESLLEYNKSVVVKPRRPRLTILGFLDFAHSYKRQVVYIQSMR